MKNKLIRLGIFGFILCTAISTFAQSAEQIAQIRAEVNSINKNAKKYTKKTKDVDDVSLEGTKATYFSSGKGLMKISAKMYGETYNASGEFYYQGEELIFAYLKFNRYDTQIGLDKPVKIVKVEEKRFVFRGRRFNKTARREKADTIDR